MLANLLSAHAIVAAVHVPFGLVAAPALLGLAIRRARVNREAT
jgi:hypothetical protein